MKKVLVLLVVGLMLVSVVGCTEDSEVEIEPTAVPDEAVDLVLLLEETGEALAEAEAEVGFIMCISAQNCLREGMQCDLGLFETCKSAGHLPADAVPLDCYTTE